MSDREHLPEHGSIVLGPTDDEASWGLTVRDEQFGEESRIVLPLERLREIDAEFTGHIP